MDRKSHKKVRKYIIIYLVFFVFFSMFLFLLERYEAANDRQRMFGIIAAHPELEAEIMGEDGTNKGRGWPENLKRQVWL